MDTAEQKLTPNKKVGILAGTLLFIVKGLRQGTIKSRPVINFTNNGCDVDMKTLEDEIWEALNKCGIKEKK